MYDQLLKELEYISKSAGVPVEYTQGGGGNTSVKLTDELMAVKASGYKLKQITPSCGYVVVNYKNIKNWYKNIEDYYKKNDLNADVDYEKESTEFVKKNIVSQCGDKPLRPSVEAGFHSLLKKYAIHTHSVYANILCCTMSGRETANRIFGARGYAYVWIPYTNPGFRLTLGINGEIRRYLANAGRFPDVILMENHGLIVTSDDSTECAKLHRDVNDAIKEYLKITDKFPDIKLVEIDDNICTSRTQFLTDFFKNSGVTGDFFDEFVLYPDQLVYLNGGISVNSDDNRLNINTKTGEITYRAGFSEALAMEETLLAYVYILSVIKEKGLLIKTMPPNGMDFIKNWESEAYRKSLMREKRTGEL